jgi:hypothetical protein
MEKKLTIFDVIVYGMIIIYLVRKAIITLVHILINLSQPID